MEHALPGSKNLRSMPVVDHRRGQQADAGVIVLVVVPAEEALTEAAGIFL